MNAKRLWRSVIFLIIFGLGVWALLWLIHRENPAEIIANLKQFGILIFLGFLAMSFINFAFASWRLGLLVNNDLKKGEKKIPARKVFLNRMAGYGFGYLTPIVLLGGEPVKIGLLAKDGANAQRASGAVILDSLFDVTANVLFVFVGIGLALLQGLAGNGEFTPIIIGMVILLLLIGAFFWRLGSGRGVIQYVFRALQLHRVKRLWKICNGIIGMEKRMSDYLQKDKKAVMQITILSFIIVTFRLIEIWYIAYFLGVNLTFVQAFLASTLPGVALFLPVPGAIGVFEGGFAAVFVLLAIPLNAVAFALIIRARDLMFIILGMSHLMVSGREFIRKYVFRSV